LPTSSQLVRNFFWVANPEPGFPTSFQLVRKFFGFQLVRLVGCGLNSFRRRLDEFRLIAVTTMYTVLAGEIVNVSWQLRIIVGLWRWARNSRCLLKRSRRLQRQPTCPPLVLG